MIPNIVNSVKGYMEHENEIMTKIAEARKSVDNAQGIDEKIVADANLSQAVREFSIIVENYPDLKANTQFTALMDELAGTENRIAYARNEYKLAIEVYNKKIKSFPTNIIAGMFGFEAKEYPELPSYALEVPSVEF